MLTQLSKLIKYLEALHPPRWICDYLMYIDVKLMRRSNIDIYLTLKSRQLSYRVCRHLLCFQDTFFVKKWTRFWTVIASRSKIFDILCCTYLHLNCNRSDFWILQHLKLSLTKITYIFLEVKKKISFSILEIQVLYCVSIM